MVDSQIILAKASAVTKHLRRLKEKAAIDCNSFLGDADSQDVALFNIQMAQCRIASTSQPISLANKALEYLQATTRCFISWRRTGTSKKN